MNYKIFYFVSLFFLMSFAPIETNLSDSNIISKTHGSFEAKAANLYAGLNANHFELPQLKSFSQALKGFYQLQQKGMLEKDMLTIIDFSLSSNTKRLWIIDLATNTILMNTYVAHGKNTGEEFANSFSNADSSNKSSLGFYTTGEIYNGKHGMSLKLDGLEKGVNDHARQRGIVMHAADYVSTDFIRNHQRLGRSQGCPAVPAELSNEIIQMIKNKSCLFIYHPSRNYSSENLFS
ncbi:murein L,D-transpeptidase catalytic domain family protein [Flavobacterium sp.]|uniref:murein L,D-transpeptidase catalytic domain family protein n=1 Tax=Flavobacterium sp. TaxID=239 RepID=UPI00286BC835|nr:murein L,D-transpeptidase catalytic domain family protein [Flavobacterium sp.]